MGKIVTVLLLVLAVILAACGEESETVEETALPETAPTMEPATDTPSPATDTPIPATDTPTPVTINLENVKEPVTCDGVEGPCVEVIFDGENCLVDCLGIIFFA